MTKGGEQKENIRAVALEILLKWDRDKVNSDALILNVLDTYSYVGRENRAFLKRLAEGTIENVILIDHIINQKSNIPSEKLKPVVRAILRLGVYQLIFMTSVPSHAAINESVRLAKLKHLGKLSGYINAVLRNVDRERPDLDLIEDISVRYSCPTWLTKLIERDYGREETEKILASFIGAKKLYVRVNTVRTDAQSLKDALSAKGLEVRQAEGCDVALEVGGVDMLRQLDEFRKGLFSVQDLSSMSIGGLIELRKNMRVLDLCAAPGGKCTHAAERLYGIGTVEARDVSERKLELIRENVERLDLDNIEIRLSDAREHDADSVEKYDVVIADLPCSGIGVIGRKNEIKYRLKPEDINSLSLLQRQIIDASGDYVRKGGEFIYSVCTITREETFSQRDYIHDMGFELKSEKLFLPGADGFDGFYYAVFTRQR